MSRAFAGAALALSFAAAAGRAPAGPEAPARVPVLVELFTSEGCSSCPPADALLARLVRAQPVAGVEVLALGEHVDYWDSLGWRDPFSSHELTLRQEQYAAQLGSGRIYTPQAIVGGRLDVLGSDEAAMRRALEGTRDGARGALVVRRGAGADVLRVEATNLPPHGAADVLLALVEDGLSSKVAAGENKGRTLAHAAVVRRLLRLGSAEGAGFSGEQAVAPDPSWGKSSLRAVAFVQERGTGRVLAAGGAALDRR